MIAIEEAQVPRSTSSRYAGLVTRTIAFALDVAIINVVALSVGGVVALGLSALHLPNTVETVLAAVAGVVAVAWGIGYFAWFWSTVGETPGDRALGLRVVCADTGEPPSWSRAVARLGGVFLSAALFCLGFVMILFDDRRRALHDRLVGTVVVYRPRPGPRGAGPRVRRSAA